jgi:hypothetical protein
MFLGYQILLLKSQIKTLDDKIEKYNTELIKLLEKLSNESTNLSISETSSVVTENLSNNDYSSVVGIACFCAIIFVYFYFGIKSNTNYENDTTLSTFSTNTSISPSSKINDGGTIFVDSVNNNIVGVTNISAVTISETANYKDVTLGITYQVLPQTSTNSFNSSITTLNGVVQNTPLTDTQRQIAVARVRDQFTNLMNQELQQNHLPVLPARTSIQSELETAVTQGLIDSSDVVSIASDTVSVISNSI